MCMYENVCICLYMCKSVCVFLCECACVTVCVDLNEHVYVCENVYVHVCVFQVCVCESVCEPVYIVFLSMRNISGYTEEYDSPRLPLCQPL